MEEKIADYYYSQKDAALDLRNAPYRSESEWIVAGIFANEDIRFEYEPSFLVGVDNRGDRERRT